MLSLRRGFVFISFLLFAENVLGKQTDLRDFNYNINLTIKDDSTIFDNIADIVSESEIKSEINKLAVFSKQKERVSSMTALNDRVKTDLKTLYKKLHILGYYNADIQYNIEENKNNEVVVFIKVGTGNKFKLNFLVQFKDQDQEFNDKYSKIFQEKFKSYKASMPEIRNMINDILLTLQCNGFYDPKAFKKKVWIDYKKEEAFLDLQIICGREVIFGKTKIEAFPGISEQFIKNRLCWKEGDQFNQEKVESSEENLRSTQIFSSIQVEPGDIEEDDDKSISMKVMLKEEKKHMLDIGLMYKGARNMNFEKSSQTTKGVKSIVAKISWTRLNAFGKGEKLVVNAEGTPMKANQKRVDYGFEVILTQPDIFTKDAMMKYSVSYIQELTNVFFRKTQNFRAKYSFPLVNYLTATIGTTIETNYVDSDPIFFAHTNLSKYYDVVAFPVSLMFDKTDNLLNPTSGYKLEVNGNWMVLRKSPVHNLKTYGVDFSYNYSIDKLKKNILSFKVSHKGILCNNIDIVPVDKRMYGGGYNSVRGYGNQMATEMVKGADVTMGGKSLWEFNTEYRRQINKDWGAVAFFDGVRVCGNQSKYFEIEKKRHFFSVGAGVRYYTSIGPIRLDFAFPINRRKGVDSKMQFIMGLGQAF